MTRRSTQRRRATAVLAAALLAATAGCGDSTRADADPTTPPSTTGASKASPSPTPTQSMSPEDQAIQQAEQAIRDFYRVTDEVFSDPKTPLRRLDSVTVARERAELTAQLRADRDDGLRSIGRTQIVDTQVTNVDLTNRPKQQAPEIPTVEISVCYDVSDVNVVDRQGKSVVLPSRKDRARAKFGVVNYDWPNPSGWKVGWTEVKGEPCDG